MHALRTKLKTVALLGFLTIIVPFFGIPLLWKQWALALLGLGIIWCAVLLLLRLPRQDDNKGMPVYAENGHGAPKGEPESDSVL
jgi:hypothetical protein